VGEGDPQDPFAVARQRAAVARELGLLEYDCPVLGRVKLGAAPPPKLKDEPRTLATAVHEDEKAKERRLAREAAIAEVELFGATEGFPDWYMRGDDPPGLPS